MSPRQVTKEEFEKFLSEHPEPLGRMTHGACDPPVTVYRDEHQEIVATIIHNWDAQHPTGHPDKKPDWKEYYVYERQD